MRLYLGLCAAVAALLLAGCGAREETRDSRMLVAVSIAPLYDFARRVGGDHVQVELLVPPAASPHTYQLEPRQMKTLSKASVLVLNGIGLEYWADKAVGAAGNSGLVVVRTADGLPIRDAGDTDHPSGNPHVWLNPVYAIRQVKVIRDALAKADPANGKAYATNATRLIGQLSDLDKEIRTTVKTFRSRSFVAFHPAWAYFADEYGLVQAAVIEDSPGKEPTSAQLRSVVETARKLKATAIFAERQFSPKSARVIADEVGAQVLQLDPLGQPPDYDYIRMMRGNIAQMSKALGK